jgi:TonB family protein
LTHECSSSQRSRKGNYYPFVGMRVLRSIPLLDAAAVEAVRQWVYEPMVVNGRPRPVTFTVTVRFVLK